MRIFFLLLVLPCVLGEDNAKQTRHLKDVDLSEFKGVRITTDNSIVTLGQKEEIQLFRYFFFFLRAAC